MGIAFAFCDLLDPDHQSLIFVNDLDRHGKSCAADGQQAEHRQPETTSDEATTATLCI